MYVFYAILFFGFETKLSPDSRPFQASMQGELSPDQPNILFVQMFSPEQKFDVRWKLVWYVFDFCYCRVCLLRSHLA